VSLNPDNYNLKQISDTDMKKVEALKKLISEGNYTVPAEDLVPKLMESVFRNTILDEAPNGALGSRWETGDQAVHNVSGGAVPGRNDSRSASVPYNGAATKQKSR
jgi:hypothetical protein